ncbi:5' exonuclease Apollo-like [Mytilus edulis]|uniref:5' exonuclease Apollo-like n=1 Tax=Mytilus edulis TaxID=6550 RepID=UPI0039EFC354
MNGHIIPGTPIAVDFWKKRDCPSAKFFFLTHLHGDHTVGLSSSWQYNIYCSAVTSKLLTEKYGIKDDLVNVLETGSSSIIYLDDEKQEQMVVSVIDANHCPGSAMFLFEGYFGKVLYTGDFRYCNLMFEDTPLFNCSDIDILYLDNTYCSPECIFPTREEAVEKLIKLVQEHKDHRIIIGMRNLGKEDLLVKIAQRTQEWISVPSSMYRTAEILGLPNVFCIEDKECKIRVVPFHTVNKSNIIGWNEYEPTLVILPSSLYTGLGCIPYEGIPNVHIVPYSDHSSYAEICTFVERVKPKYIYPVVNERPRSGIFGKLSERSDLSCLNKYLSKEESVKFTIPKSVKKFMSLPMTKYMRKVSRQKKQGCKIPLLKKKTSVSLGVVFDSPQKSQLNESAQEFENQLEKMKRSFKKVPKSKSNLLDNTIDVRYDQVSKSTIDNDKPMTKLTEMKLGYGESNVNADYNCSPDTSNKRNEISDKRSDQIEPTLNTSNQEGPICDKYILFQDGAGQSNTHSHKHLLKCNDSVEKCVSDSTIDNHNVGIQTSSKLDDNTFTKTKSNQGQKKLDIWFRSAISVTNSPVAHQSCQYTEEIVCPENDTSFSLPAETNYSMDKSSLLYNNNIPASEKVKLIPLKPLNMKRKASTSLDLCLIPITQQHTNKNYTKCKKGKRKSDEDSFITPSKKARTVL